MKEKFYYQQGRCECNSYLSLNPVVYVESTTEPKLFLKDRMDCRCIINGECDRTYTCSLLQDAPESIIDDGVTIRDKKLG